MYNFTCIEIGKNHYLSRKSRTAVKVVFIYFATFIYIFAYVPCAVKIFFVFRRSIFVFSVYRYLCTVPIICIICTFNLHMYRIPFCRRTYRLNQDNFRLLFIITYLVIISVVREKCIYRFFVIVTVVFCHTSFV